MEQASDTPIKRLLCCNVLTSDEHSQPGIFRHSFYSYEEAIEWPPEQWKVAHCNYCAHAFDRPGTNGREFVPPVPIPFFHDKKLDVWRVFGMYCSWNCAKAEILNQQGYSCGGTVLLLEKLAREVFEYKGPPIVPAPPKTRLSYFYPGGLDIDTFRGQSADSFTTVLHPPLLSLPEIYEKHALVTATPTWSVKGIRVNQCSVIKASETPDAEGSESLFNSFVKRGSSSGITHGTLESQNIANEGTLINWMDAKPAFIKASPGG